MPLTLRHSKDATCNQQSVVGPMFCVAVCCHFMLVMVMDGHCTITVHIVVPSIHKYSKIWMNKTEAGKYKKKWTEKRPTERVQCGNIHWHSQWANKFIWQLLPPRTLCLRVFHITCICIYYVQHIFRKNAKISYEGIGDIVFGGLWRECVPLNGNKSSRNGNNSRKSEIDRKNSKRIQWAKSISIAFDKRIQS